MTRHIKIKVLTRLSEHMQDYHWGQYIIGDLKMWLYCERGQLELIDDIFYNVQWINKHDTSLDKTFNNPLDQLESLSIR